MDSSITNEHDHQKEEEDEDHNNPSEMLSRQPSSQDEHIIELHRGSPSSHSNHSSTSRQQRVVELLQEPSNNDDHSSDWVIGAEFYDEDVAENSDHQSGEEDDEVNIETDEDEHLDEHGGGADDSGDEFGNYDDDVVLVMPSDQSEEDDDDDSDGTDNYDTTLPVGHGYLGEDLEESRGRLVMVEGSIQRLLLLNLRGTVIFPGQVLPITTSNLNFRVESYLKGCIARGITTVGMMSNPHENKIGTTTEIRNYSMDENDLRLIMEGRQRFQLLSAPFETAIEGEIRILPEVSLGRPFPHIAPLARFLTAVDPPGKFIISKHPHWLLKRYDARIVMKRILQHIKDWAGCSGGVAVGSSSGGVGGGSSSGGGSGVGIGDASGASGAGGGAAAAIAQTTATATATMTTATSNEIQELSKDSNEFSYWVAGNLPISDSERRKVLEFGCTEARLIWLLQLLEKAAQLGCSNCREFICHKSDVFQMSRSGPQCSFVNPSGFIHDTLTVRAAPNLNLAYGWSSECSWFPSYLWRMAYCRGCGQHIGWCYKASELHMKPRRFFGLSRVNLRLLDAEGKATYEGPT